MLGFFKKNRFRSDPSNMNFYVKDDLLLNGEQVVRRNAKLTDFKPTFEFWQKDLDIFK